MAEYDDLLTEATAKANAFRATAKNYIPRMYAALRNENPNISAEDIGDRIKKDCVSIWSRRTIIDALPDEAKDPKKQESGRLGQKKHNSAAVSAAQNGQAKKQIIVDDESSTTVEEVKRLCDNKNDDYADPDLSIMQLTAHVKNDTSYSTLLSDNRQLRKQLSSVLEERTRYTNEINDLRDALARCSFKPASQALETRITQIVLNLQEFGNKLLSMIQRGQSSCIIQLDHDGRVIGLEAASCSGADEMIDTA